MQNLPTTSENQREYFAQCGTVESATVITDRLSGQSRGFGFVEVSTTAEGQEAAYSGDGEQRVRPIVNAQSVGS